MLQHFCESWFHILPDNGSTFDQFIVLTGEPNAGTSIHYLMVATVLIPLFSEKIDLRTTCTESFQCSIL